MRKSILALALALVVGVQAQELRCSVTVNSDKIEGSSKEVFETLRKSIEEYMNNNRWTNMTYAEFEKIECNMMILVNKVEGNLFSCEMTIQSKRQDIFRHFGR